MIEALLEVLGKAWPYLLAAAVAAAGSVWITHRLDTVALDSLQAKYSQYVAQSETLEAAQEAAANKAISAQLQTHLTIETTNAQVIGSLQDQVDAAKSDAAFAKQLLSAAAKAQSAGSGSVFATGSGPAADDATKGSSDKSAFNLLGVATDSITECRDAIQRLAALQLEIAPQLKQVSP